ncbi:MAG: hypothetical protein HWN68_17245 [Desulfobacterales bacterium]|nr:hypothetical protein [Desulfobacterales bacterium]
MEIELSVLALLSLVAYLEKNAIFWMMTGAASLFIGFYWYDMFTTNLGLAVGLCFIGYWLVSWSIAFKCMLFKDRADK